jgi:hypothetical protein
VLLRSSLVDKRCSEGRDNSNFSRFTHESLGTTSTDSKTTEECLRLLCGHNQNKSTTALIKGLDHLRKLDKEPVALPNLNDKVDKFKLLDTLYRMEE